MSKIKEKVKEYKLLFHPNGGRMGMTTKLSIPKSWVDDMGIKDNTEESRKVILIYSEEEKMIIIKPKYLYEKEAEEFCVKNEDETPYNV